MTDPSGGRTLLASLVAAEHTRLHALVREASTRTPTPGVRSGLGHQLADAVLAHEIAEQRVVEPALRWMLGDETAARVRSTTEQLRDRAHQRPSETDDIDDWLQSMRDALDAHCRMLDDELLPRLASLDRDAMATLGYRFAEALDVTGQRR
ncbi:MAG TPA: hemerythrin domain-containing protein [Acidimicrobiales bacterium]